MKIFLDDIRHPATIYPDPKAWTVVRSPYSFRLALDLNWDDVTAVSLDNDLGEGKMEGYQLLDWIEDRAGGCMPHFDIYVHSANVAAATRMRMTLARMRARTEETTQ